jgi:quinolinate synthase
MRLQASRLIDSSQTSNAVSRIEEVSNRLRSCGTPQDRLKFLLDAGRASHASFPFPDEQKVPINRVLGCTSQVWISARLDDKGRVQFMGTSDSSLTLGVLALMMEALSGLAIKEVVSLDAGLVGEGLELGPSLMMLASPSTPSRSSAASNILETMKKRARALGPDGLMPRFPSLLIGSGGRLEPQGAFAEAQAQYLNPDPSQIDLLASILKEKNMGVVAHFYMDPEVQGVLMSVAERWPHVYISDSLVMADTAVKMANAGCTSMAVLGVDFMSENVRAILDEAGFNHVKVYRMSPESIGCSLAEAAESQEYIQYLTEASKTPKSLHVVYINTSLVTKAAADSLVPTITCTSSNVVQTVLQGFAQVPDATIWYGPDTYMGRNLAALFTSLSSLSDEQVKEIHPLHTAASIKALLPRLKYYESGTCIVHHIFGGEVCELVKLAYNDAYLTAHFEVPGEMFGLAIQAKQRGMGTVGSTSNILDFIAGRVKEALSRPHPDRLQFILGTEAGMITSIVRKVQQLMKEAGDRPDVQVEIVFPVASRAISTPQQTVSGTKLELPGGISMVPGPASGEGCSLERGCAACPYMRMNTLSALISVATKIGSPGGEAMLEAYKPKPYSDLIGGKTIAQAGCVPILSMRHFQKSGQLSDALVNDINDRAQS